MAFEEKPLDTPGLAAIQLTKKSLRAINIHSLLCVNLVFLQGDFCTKVNWAECMYMRHNGRFYHWRSWSLTFTRNFFLGGLICSTCPWKLPTKYHVWLSPPCTIFQSFTHKFHITFQPFTVTLMAFTVDTVQRYKTKKMQYLHPVYRTFLG